MQHLLRPSQSSVYCWMNFNYINWKHWSTLCLYWECAAFLDVDCSRAKATSGIFLFIEALCHKLSGTFVAWHLHYCVTIRWHRIHHKTSVQNSTHKVFHITNMLLCGNVLSYKLAITALFTQKISKSRYLPTKKPDKISYSESTVQSIWLTLL